MNPNPRSGRLIWDTDGQRLTIQLEGDRVRGVRLAHLSAELRGIPSEQLDGVTVHASWHNGQPRDIRPAGAPPAARRPRPPRADAFLNPYTFVPALPREQLAPALGDAAPAGHDRLHEQRWTGRLAVVLTVGTPLLLLDVGRATTDSAGHTTYPVLRDPADAPQLRPTTVKGMLRAAYEAVTNSRLGVFTGHDRPLAYRVPTTASQRVVPVRISDDDKSAVLLPGDTPPGGQAAGAQACQHAAWLPRREPAGPTYDTGGVIPEGAPVDAIVELVQHWRWDRNRQTHSGDFRLWQVRAVVPAGTPLPAVRPGAPRDKQPGRSFHEPLGTSKKIHGWAHITNRNINRKHDDRIFFADSQPSTGVPLTDSLRQQWTNLVLNYRAAHRPKDIHERRRVNGSIARPADYLGSEPGKTAWSPHLYDDDYLELRPGRLCYAMLGPTGQITGLYPVIVSRQLFARSPAELPGPSLRPAENLAELSPADRVFGWVRDGGHGAYRGHLRVGPISCDQGADAIDDSQHHFGPDGVPLAVLGSPKPQQGRFYVSASRPDQPLPDRTSKNRWYGNQQLRGRKFYWHHAGLTDEYWACPVQDRTQTQVGHRFQEYRRPRVETEEPLIVDGCAFATTDEERRDDQNCSIRGWIKPGTTFRFTIEVVDLTDVELGALAWLLRLPEQHYLKLGYGKPLGFGSVRLTVDPAATQVRPTEAWIAHYRTLQPAEPAASDDTLSELDKAAADFAAVAPNTVLEAFAAVCRGRADARVHYPRTRPPEMAEDVPVPPDPRGRAYTWFVANEQERNRQIRQDRGRSLPRATATDPTLPLYEDPRAH